MYLNVQLASSVPVGTGCPPTPLENLLMNYSSIQVVLQETFLKIKVCVGPLKLGSWGCLGHRPQY